jgi:hypothetical protein
MLLIIYFMIGSWAKANPVVMAMGRAGTAANIIGSRGGNMTRRNGENTRADLKRNGPGAE